MKTNRRELFVASVSLLSFVCVAITTHAEESSVEFQYVCTKCGYKATKHRGPKRYWDSHYKDRKTECFKPGCGGLMVTKICEDSR